VGGKVHRELRAHEHERCWSALAVARRSGTAAHAHGDADDGGRSGASGSTDGCAGAKAHDQQCARGVRCRGERVRNECTTVSAAGVGPAMASGAAARLLHRRRVRAAVPILLCESLCRLPAGTDRGCSWCRSARAVRRGAADPKRSSMDASAPAPSSAAIAPAWPW
jgi:hypothetical protein